MRYGIGSKLRSLIEHSPDGITLCDERGLVIEPLFHG